MTQSSSKNTDNPTTQCSHSLHPPTVNHTASKKRLFVRKPGPNFLPFPSEKHRKSNSELVDTEETSKESCVEGEVQESKEHQQPKTLRMQRHTQNFKKQCLLQSSFTSTKQLSSSPRRTKADLLLGLKYIQRPSEQKNGQNLTSRSKHPVIRISGLDEEQTVNLDDTSDNSLKNQLSRDPQSWKALTKKQDQVNCDSAHRLKNLIKGMSYTSLFDKIDLNECALCKNLKKVNQFLSQKCTKLEKQLQLRTEDIKLLSEKVGFFQENQKNSIEAAQLREEMYLREMQIYQECSTRYENVRKELSRVVQRVKYLEIENGVLARYKQDFLEAQKDYEKIKQQNDMLKKQISTISRMGQKYNGRKPTNIQGVRREYAVGKSPYFKMTKQQDTISLELSQASYEHL